MALPLPHKLKRLRFYVQVGLIDSYETLNESSYSKQINFMEIDNEGIVKYLKSKPDIK